MKLRMFLSVALFGLFSMSASAQSFGDLLKKVTSGTSALSTAKDYVVSLLGTDKVTAADLSGTWSYSEPAVVFESENVVSKLGGAALAQSTEKQLASLLEKIGLEAGKIQLTFNEDGSYVCTMNGRDIKGTYEVADTTLTLKKLNFTTLKSNVKKTGNTLQLSVDADKLLTLISSITSIVPQDGLLSTVTGLINNFDGMKIGVKFTK